MGLFLLVPGLGDQQHQNCILGNRYSHTDADHFDQGHLGREVFRDELVNCYKLGFCRFFGTRWTRVCFHDSDTESKRTGREAYCYNIVTIILLTLCFY